MTDPTTPAARPLPADVAGLVERATAALDGVTPGPWVAVRASHGPVDVFSGDRDVVTFYGTNFENDARFTAAARQLVPDLTAAIEAQARKMADLTAERDRQYDENVHRIAEQAKAETRAEKDRAENARLREALDNLLDAIMAQDRFGDRALTITGSTAALKWLIEAEDDARAALKGGDNG